MRYRDPKYGPEPDPAFDNPLPHKDCVLEAPKYPILRDASIVCLSEFPWWHRLCAHYYRREDGHSIHLEGGLWVHRNPDVNTRRESPNRNLRGHSWLTVTWDCVSRFTLEPERGFDTVGEAMRTVDRVFPDGARMLPPKWKMKRYSNGFSYNRGDGLELLYLRSYARMTLHWNRRILEYFYHMDVEKDLRLLHNLNRRYPYPWEPPTRLDLLMDTDRGRYTPHQARQ